VAGCQQLADPLENPGDQAVVLHKVVDHRCESGLSRAKRRKQLTVFPGVMGVYRGAEAKTVTEQVLRDDRDLRDGEVLRNGCRGRATGSVSGFTDSRSRPPERDEPLPQRLVNLNQLLAERRHAIGRSQQGC
jgi:hypothetical protein